MHYTLTDLSESSPEVHLREKLLKWHSRLLLQFYWETTSESVVFRPLHNEREVRIFAWIYDTVALI